MQNEVKDNEDTEYKFKEGKIQDKSLCFRKGTISPSPLGEFQTKSIRGVGYRSSG